MIIKLMGSEDAPDDDSRKLCRLIAGVSSIEFRPYEIALLSPGPGGVEKEAAIRFFDGSDEEVVLLYGNVYVMNDQGKTIDSHGASTVPQVSQGHT